MIVKYGAELGLAASSPHSTSHYGMHKLYIAVAHVSPKQAEKNQVKKEQHGARLRTKTGRVVVHFAARKLIDYAHAH